MQDTRRRSSLLDSLKSPLLASNDLSLLGAQQQANSSNNNNNNNINNTSNTDNPFQLNSSIWQNASSPTNDGSFSSNYAVPSYSNATQFNNRRASDFHQNYTTWSSNGQNNNNSFSEDWDLSPRKYSLDSYQSINNPMSPSQQHLQQQAYQQQQQQQQPQQFQSTNTQSPLPPNYGSNSGSFSGNSPYEFVTSTQPTHSQQNAVYPNESTPQLTQHYQALDFYFNNDPYNRISMNVEALNNTSIESLLSQKAADGSQITLPKFPNNSQLPSQQLFLVSFKSGRIDCFYLPESSSLVLKVGDLVIVEADRGKDLGKIVKLNLSIDEFRLLKYLQFMEQQAAVNSFESTSSSIGSNNAAGAGNNAVPTLHFPKPILRLALSQEAFQLLTKLQDEEKAKKICQFKIESSPLIGSRESAEPSSLPATPQTSLASSMSIIDSEYQFDRKKLIFYYKANHRIDFRDLVRDLFRIYKTRIWMCAVNSNHVVQSPPPEQTHLAQLNKIDMKALASPVFQQPSLYTGDYHQQQQLQQQLQQQQFNPQQQQYQPQPYQQSDHFEVPQNDFTGFNQNIWGSSSPSLPPQSSSVNYYGNMNYNLPSSQGTAGHQNSIVGMMNEPISDNVVGSGAPRSASSAHSGSFSIWNS